VLYLLPGIFVLGIGIFILKSSFFKSHEPDTHYEFRPPNITDSLKSTQIEQIFVYKPRDTENTIFDRQKYLDSNNKTISQQRELGSENSNGKDRIPIPNNIKHEIIQRSRNACENPDCQMKYPIHIHHIDMNRTNNSKKNLIALCPKCHKDAHNGILINSQLRNWVMADYNRLRHEREN
jgi:hypothetical protein